MKETAHLFRQLNYLLMVAFLALTGVLGSVTTARADHYAGSELTYAYTGVPGKYLLRLRFYRDCGGIDLYGEMPVNGYAPGCSPVHQTFLLDLNYSEEITEVCPGQATECTTPPDNSVAGVKVYEYTKIVDVSPFSQGCSNWVFFLEGFARNDGILNLNNGVSSGIGFYTEALLNTDAGVNNSSPVFASSPVPFVCRNEIASYNLQATDPDGDSLSYALVGALTSGGLPVSYTIGYSSQHPFGNFTGYTANLNSQTGQLLFKATLAGPYVVVFRVQEWRRINGQMVLVGSMRRDVQVQVVNCTSPAPQLQNLMLEENGGVTVTFPASEIQELEACMPYCYLIPVFTTGPPELSLTLSSNAVNEIPNATFSVMGQNSQNPVGRVCFAPSPLLDGQTVTFTISAKDNACPFTNDITQAISFKVKKSTGFTAFASPGTVCAGQMVQINTLGIAGKLPLSDSAYLNFNWSAYDMQGVPVNGHFQGNTNTPSVVAAPSQTTRYVVSCNTNFGCTDTASVVVHVTGITPSIQSINTYNNILCQGQTSALTPVVAAPANVTFPVSWSAVWSPASGLSDSSAISPIVAYSGQQNVAYQVIISNGNCSDTSTVTISFVDDNVTVQTTILPDSVCAGEAVQLEAIATGNGSAGCGFHWVSGERIAEAGSQSTSALPGNLGPGLYVMKVTTAQGCLVLDTAKVVVTGAVPHITPFPAQGISVCSQQPAQINTTVTFDSLVTNPAASFIWSPGTGLSDSTISNPEVSFSGQSQVIYNLKVSSGTCSNTEQIIVNFIPAISVRAIPPSDEICLGDSVPLTAVVSPSNLPGTEFLWSAGTIIGPSSHQALAVPQTPGIHTFYVTASLQGGCLSTDSVVLDIAHVRPEIRSLTAVPNPVCPGKIATITGNVSSAFGHYTPGFSYRWAKANRLSSIENEADTFLTLSPEINNWYFLVASDNGSCEAVDSVQILVEEIHSDFDFELHSEHVNQSHVKATFTNNSYPNSEIENVYWEIREKTTGQAYLPGKYGNSTSFEFNEFGVFEAVMVITTTSGCEFTVSKPLSIGAGIAPNVITPNGDGFNDRFFIAGLPVGSIVRIFNRWGREIAQFGHNESWSPENSVSAGIYFYSVSGNGNNKSGWLEILR